jgi:hypothetical protein
MADAEPLPDREREFLQKQAAAAERAAVPGTCEHAWASKHEPGHLLYWVRQCVLCHAVDWDDLDAEIGRLAGHGRIVTMNYVEEIAARLGALLDDCPAELLRLYALLVLVRGRAADREDVHDAWSAWRTATKPDHAALIPFDQLTPEVQALDDPYVAAIREVAATPSGGDRIREAMAGS